MNRRRFLVATLPASLPLAGCTGTSSTDPTSRTATNESPSSTDTSTATPCGPGSTRLALQFEMAEPPVGGFDLSVAASTVPVGGTLAVALTNVSDGDRITGNRYKYDVQRRVDGNWRSVFRHADHPIWMDDAVEHAPGEGFDWEIEVSGSGLTHGIERGSGELVVCDGVRPGEHRFVYWGVSGDGESGGGVALAAEFAVTEG